MRTRNTSFVFVMAALLVLSLNAVGAGQEFRVKDNLQTVEAPKWAPAEIIVKFKPGVSDDVIRGINDRQGSSVLSISNRGQFRRLRIPPNKTVEEMVAIYSKNPNVEYAEQNFIATALMVPNDTYYSYQWHLRAPAHGGINMESAWNIQTGSPDVIVAVIDTGVAYENYAEGTRRLKKYYYLAPDLASTLFVAGYDFVNNDDHPNDDEGHGTHVTGTIAQSTNNNLGVAGIAFNTSIMPVKVLNSLGSGSYTDIADGIYFAADNGAAVINMSLGGSSPSTTLENALAYAYGMGVTIVCAAGNNSSSTLSYPAAYNTYCIAVGATRYDQTLAYYSNYGSGLDLVAPGGDIYVDQNGDTYSDGVLQQTFGNSLNDWGYFFYQGTSMAAPHVSGVAALLIANGNADTDGDGVTSPDEVRAALQDTARDLGAPGWDSTYGWGLLDAYAALAFSPAPIHDVAVIALNAPLDAYQGDAVSISVTVTNQGTDAETTTVTLTDTTAGSLIGSQPVTLDPGDSTLIPFNWNTTGASITGHVLLAQAGTVPGETDTADNTMTTTVTVNEPVHDVAITALNAPSQAIEGDVVPVSITVQNQGSFAETTTITLRDATDNTSIGSQVKSVAAGASTTVSFDWNTTGASITAHLLEANASVVSGETDTADNSATTTVNVNEASAVAMHVAGIAMSLKNAGVNYNGVATVTIVNTAGAPVAGTTVSAKWSGATSDSDVGTTDAAGQITLQSDKLKKPSSGTTFTVTVTNVTNSGWTYNPADNAETSDSVAVP
ncbi:MAG TPA: S8 family serine peptidase [Sedimentisphaerales bacterium]|nr:S8 family serine peptidase [Sedimentisphaerales bacterium]